MSAILIFLRTSLCLLIFFTVITGVLYPLAVMTVSQLVFAPQVKGSLIEKNGKIVGSELLGQEFTAPKYFWGRLSAVTPPYNAALSGGSNLGAANPKLFQAANARLAALKKNGPPNEWKIPIDLITSSASGLDPHLALEAVEYQLPRVARARKLKEEDVRVLVNQHRTDSWLVSRPYVNILLLNLALDEVQKSSGEK